MARASHSARKPAAQLALRETPYGLGPLPLMQPFKQRLAPDGRDPARAVAFGAKPRATRKPAGHATAALADWALVICPLNIRDHVSEYMAEMQRSREPMRALMAPGDPTTGTPSVRRATGTFCALARSASVHPTQGDAWVHKREMGGLRTMRRFFVAIASSRGPANSTAAPIPNSGSATAIGRG